MFAFSVFFGIFFIGFAFLSLAIILSSRKDSQKVFCGDSGIFVMGSFLAPLCIGIALMVCAFATESTGYVWAFILSIMCALLTPVFTCSLFAHKFKSSGEFWATSVLLCLTFAFGTLYVCSCFIS